MVIAVRLGIWIDDAGHVAIARFARVLRRDIDAVHNAIELPWSNGQAEGQINRSKTIKRAMCGRAGPELLRARMLSTNCTTTQIEEDPLQMPHPAETAAFSHLRAQRHLHRMYWCSFSRRQVDAVMKIPTVLINPRSE